MDRDAAFREISYYLDDLLTKEAEISGDKVELYQYCNQCNYFNNENEPCRHYRRQGNKIEIYAPGWSCCSEKIRLGKL